MKILFLSAANSVHTVKWVNSLAERGHELHLVFNSNHAPQDNSIDGKVILHQLKYGGGSGYYRNAGKLRRLAANIAPDVINVHYASGYGTLARRAGLSNVLLSVWGSDVYEFPYQSKLKSIILKKNVNHAAFIASTSECMAAQLRKVMNQPEMEIAVTPFGVNLERFDPLKYREEHEGLVIGNIKTLKPQYGIMELVKAVAVLRSMLPETIMKLVRVEIYGEGEQREEIAGEIKKLGLQDVVELKGRIPNEAVPGALSNFDIFCATSESESFGVSIVEAMAMQKPAVVTDADGFKEVVVNGQTGLIVPKKNVDEIAKALYGLIMDEKERKRLGFNGRERVKELFDWEKNVSTMESLYSKVQR